MYFFIKTLGCKLNRYDSDQLSEALKKINLQETEKSNEADLLIINSCTVTNNADHKSRQAISSLVKINPHARIIVMGCGTKNNKTQFQNVDLISNDQAEIISFVKTREDKHQTVDRLEKNKHHSTLNFQSPINYRTRANIKIQTGCENYCSYCIIPFTRGSSESILKNDILKEITEKEKIGFKEIIITGINIGAYGASLTTKPNENKLAELLIEILEKTKIPRIRLSSIGPQYFNPKLIQVLKNPRICQHLHLSIQSASNTVLKRMNRSYSIESVIELSEELRKIIPDIALTSDIIVGFPEENGTEHLETLENLQKIKLMKTHLFPYSIRKKTVAATMRQIPNTIKIERKKSLEKIALQMRLDFIKNQIGKEKLVLFEQKNKQGLWEGYTDNYIRIKIKSENDFKNQIKKIILTGKNII